MFLRTKRWRNFDQILQILHSLFDSIHMARCTKEHLNFIESLKDSVTIHTFSKSYNTHYQLGELEELMRSDNFLRIHRSFLVAVDKIESFSAAEVEIADRVLPIGRSHKEYVMGKLGRGA